MKLITRIALAIFASAVIIFEPDGFSNLLSISLKSFGKEAAKIEKKMSKTRSHPSDNL